MAGNKNKEYILCKLKRDDDQSIVPGKEIDRYHSTTMLSPGMIITVKSKKYKIRCIDVLEDGTRKVMVE